MISLKPDDRLGRRVSYRDDRKRVNSLIAGRRKSKKPLKIFRKNEREMSTDLLRDLVEQTIIAKEKIAEDNKGKEKKKTFRGWAVMPLKKVRSPELNLDAKLTHDVESNPYHAVIWYTVPSEDLDHLQFHLELTRCITGWQDAVEPTPP